MVDKEHIATLSLRWPISKERLDAVFDNLEFVRDTAGEMCELSTSQGAQHFGMPSYLVSVCGISSSHLDQTQHAVKQKKKMKQTS